MKGNNMEAFSFFFSSAFYIDDFLKSNLYDLLSGCLVFFAVYAVYFHYSLQKLGFKCFTSIYYLLLILTK